MPSSFWSRSQPSRRSVVIGGVITGLTGSMTNRSLAAASKLDLLVQEQMQRAAIPALAIGIARHGRILLSKAYGHADIAAARALSTESMFHIASVSKTVTATGIMILVESGRIALDDPVNAHLDFAVINPAHPDRQITVRHLLMHLSSISDETYYAVDFRTRGRDSPISLRDFLKSYLVPGGSHYDAKGSFTRAGPGSSYDYSNVAYGLLGYLGGRIAGEDFRLFLRRRIFDRLGMRRASWSLAGTPARLRVTPYDEVDGQLAPIEPVGFPDWPAGMLRISIADFMTFVAASANGGMAGKTRMLRADSLSQMLAMRKPPGLPVWLTGQGLGWMESADGGAPHINHWGGDPGVFTAAYLDPATATGAAIFANISATDATKAAMKTIAKRLLDPAALA